MRHLMKYMYMVHQHFQFSRFISDISRNADCSRIYSPHCLRATVIQGMNDIGYEIRHIMYISGHKDEISVKCYNCDCSSNQKESMSDSRQLISSGNLPEQTSRQQLSQIQPVAVSRPALAQTSSSSSSTEVLARYN